MLFSALSVDQAHRAGKEKANEHSQANRLHRHVHHTGHAYGGAAPADGIVLRDRSSGQRQGRERSGCRGVGIPASHLSRSRWLFSPQCAPDAGLLPGVRRHAGIAGRGNASELDAECGHHGGRIDHGREVLVHSEGRRKRLIQNGAAADDRGSRTFGNCSWRKRGYLLYCRK